MGALRRVGPVPSGGPLSKPSRGAAPATRRGAVARESSAAAGRVGAKQKLAAPGKYTKVIYNGVVTEMEVIPVGGAKVPPNSRPVMKRPRVVETASCGTMPREKKPAARSAGADEELSVPNPKRAKVTRDGVETPVVPALGALRKRMAAEIDALHALLRKAELLSSGKNARFMAAKQQSEAPAKPSITTPPVKRMKVSASAPAKIAMLESPEEKNKFPEEKNICGGVSPIAIQEASASPIVPVEKAVETGISEIRAPPEDDDEFLDISGGVSPITIQEASPIVPVETAVETGDSEMKAPPVNDDEFSNICGGVSPVVSGDKAGASNSSPNASSDSGSSSSSDSEDSDSDSGSSSSDSEDSDSDSGSSSSSDSEDSDSDSDEAGDIPIPQAAVLPEEKRTQPASKVVKIADEPETAALIAKAKTRRQLLEMERAVLPDESIHPWELKDLCIVEYGRPGIMRMLGLFLKADA